MLIGIDASRANRKYKSGTEWYSYNLIRSLAKMDKDNQYILYSGYPLKGGLVNLASENIDNFDNNEEIRYDEDGYQVLISPHDNFKGKILKWPFNCFWTQGRLSLEMIFHRPDVLFVPAHALPYIHPNDSIVTIHDIGFIKNRVLYGSNQIGPKGRLSRWLVNSFVKLFTFGKYEATTCDYLSWSTEFALKHAKKIITISNFSKREIISNYSIIKDKIKVVYNGYNRELYKKIENQDKISAVLEKYNIKRPYIFYSGRLERIRNTPGMIEAFAQFRERNKDLDFKLVLLGKPGFGFDEVNYMIREYRLESFVIMPGWVDYQDMPYFYNGAAMYIFPAIYEGFGIPLLEAMACGTPIAAAKVSCIPEITDGAAYLFEPDDKLSITMAMEKIIRNDDFRNELINLGYERIKNFSWEECASETEKEIENIVLSK